MYLKRIRRTSGLRWKLIFVVDIRVHTVISPVFPSVLLTIAAYSPVFHSALDDCRILLNVMVQRTPLDIGTGTEGSPLTLNQLYVLVHTRTAGRPSIISLHWLRVVFSLSLSFFFFYCAQVSILIYKLLVLILCYHHC